MAENRPKTDPKTNSLGPWGPNISPPADPGPAPGWWHWALLRSLDEARQKPPKSIDKVTKPYEFIRFGAMDVTKPYEFIGFPARLPSGTQSVAILAQGNL